MNEKDESSTAIIYTVLISILIIGFCFLGNIYFGTTLIIIAVVGMLMIWYINDKTRMKKQEGKDITKRQGENNGK